MNTVILESSSEDTLELVVLMAQKLGIRTNYVKNNSSIKKKRAMLEQIIDAGGGIENSTEFLVEFERSRQDRPLPFRV